MYSHNTQQQSRNNDDTSLDSDSDSDAHESLSTLQESVEALKSSEKKLKAQNKISNEDMVSLNIRMTDMNNKLEEACLKMNGHYNKELNTCQLNITDSLLDIVKTVISKPSVDKKAETKQVHFVKNTPLIMLNTLSTKPIKPTRVMQKLIMSPMMQNLSQHSLSNTLLPFRRPRTHRRNMYYPHYAQHPMPMTQNPLHFNERMHTMSGYPSGYPQEQPMYIPQQYSYPTMSSMSAFPFAYGGKKTNKKQRGGGQGVYDTQGSCINCGFNANATPHATQHQLPQMPSVCAPSYYPQNIPPPTPMLQQHGGGHPHVWNVQGGVGPMHPDVQGGQTFALPTYAPTICKQTMFPINGMQLNTVKCGGGKKQKKRSANRSIKK